jgi:flagellar biosynthesis GTPase FlhF
MDFNWMSTSQTAALIVGLVVTVIAVATTFLAFKYARKINSFIKVVSMALVAPFLAFTSWLFLIFSFLDGFRTNEILNLFISLLISLFICAMIIIVAKALYAKNRAEIEKLEAEEEAIEATFVDQSNAIAPAEEKLMIEEEKTEEVKDAEEAEAPAEEIAEVEETEKAAEETEEATEEVPAEETVEEEIEETPVEEAVEETAEETEEPTEETVEEVVEETEEAPAEENIEETAEEEVTEEDFDDADDDFEKFLESLKAKNDDKKDEE